MIKTALKHWIYEICIDQLFDGIFKNFKYSDKKFKKFQRYSHIMERVNQNYFILFYDVIIKEIREGAAFGPVLIVDCTVVNEYSNKFNKGCKGTVCYKGVPYYFRELRSKEQYIPICLISEVNK